MECANCKKPASRACISCKKSIALSGDPPIVHYCDPKCQKGDWKKHKATCHRLKDRTTLYRVAETAQKLWYIQRELSWAHVDIKAVEKSEGHLNLRAVLNYEISWLDSSKPFPSALFSSIEDRHAALSYLGCPEALVWMVEFVASILKDIVSETKHVNIKTKNDKLRTRDFPITGPIVHTNKGIMHEILKVTLNSGESYAVDLSGAQYGYAEAVTPWSQYLSQRALWIYSINDPPKPFNILKIDDYTELGWLAWREPTPRRQNPRRILSLDTLDTMARYIIEWQHCENTSHKAVWNLPEKEFHVIGGNLVDFIEWFFHRENLNGPWFTANGRKLMQEAGLRWIHGKIQSFRS